MSWTSLPAEIRNPILAHVRDTTTGRLGPYATVCKEWQPVFERVTFSRIHFTSKPTDVNTFKRCFGGSERRQRSLAKLRVSVILPLVPMPDRGYVVEQDLLAAVSLMFGVMSKWNRDHVYAGPGGGVVLDMRVDVGRHPWVEERLRNVELQFDFFDRKSEWEEWLVSDRHPNASSRGLGQYYHRFDGSQSCGSGSSSGSGSSASTIALPRPRGVGPHGLPPVAFITSMVYVGSKFLDFSYVTLYDIVASLPGVRALHLEASFGYGQALVNVGQPRAWVQTVGLCPLRLLSRLTLNGVLAGPSYVTHRQPPESVTRNGIWPSHVHTVHHIEHSAYVAHRTGYSDVPNRFLAERFVRSGLLLENLVVVNAVSAMHFFQRAREFDAVTPTYFNYLRTLSLTAPILGEDISRSHLARTRALDLLVAAGHVAQRMPQLVSMEVWGYSPNICNIFRWSLNAVEKRATIRIDGHWGLVMPAEVVYP